MFREFGVLIHCDVHGEAIVYVYVGLEPVRGAAKNSLGLRRLGSNGGENGRPNLEDAVHEGDWAVVYCRFFGIVY